MEADALVTLGLLAERGGQPDEAIELFTAAHDQATAHAMLGVELRAAFQLSRAQLERGDLAGAATTAHQGVQRAEEAGLGLAPYGLDLQYMHYLAHYAEGCWDHAQELADGFAVRVTTVAEARLSAMALFVDVARGNPVVAERRAWLEPFWAADRFSEYIARGLLAEHALWRGDTAGALAEVAAALAAAAARQEGYGPPVIRVAAIGLAARADRAVRARAAGDEQAAQAEVDAAEVLIEAAREGAAYPRRPKFVLGVEGRGWLARAEAEWGRARGRQQPGGLAGGGGHVRPRVRLRDGPVPVAAGRGAGRGRAARPRPSRNGGWPSAGRRASWARSPLLAAPGRPGPPGPARPGRGLVTAWC